MDQAKIKLLTEMIEESSARITTMEGKLDQERRFREELVRKRADESGARVALTFHADQHLATSLRFQGLDNKSEALPSLIARILSKSKRPMRAKEIVNHLTSEGVSTPAKRGLTPNVISALTRRTDLFHKVERGTYELKTENGKA